MNGMQSEKRSFLPRKEKQSSNENSQQSDEKYHTRSINNTFDTPIDTSIPNSNTTARELIMILFSVGVVQWIGDD